MSDPLTEFQTIFTHNSLLTQMKIHKLKANHKRAVVCSMQMDHLAKAIAKILLRYTHAIFAE